MKLLKSKIGQFIVLFVGCLLILNLSRNIFRLLRAGGRVREVEEKVSQLESEQAKLLKKKEFYASEEFVEQEARNKLNMAKPGETIVVLPPNVPEILGRTTPAEAPNLPNWKKWWNLFF